MKFVKTKIVFACTFIIFINLNCFTQDNFIPYYRTINKAEMNCISEHFDSALNYYNLAFSMVKTPLMKDLYNACICSSLSNRTEPMYYYMELCLKKGLKFSIFESNNIVFNKFHNDTIWQYYKSRSLIYFEEFNKTIDLDYIRKLDSIETEDQRIRQFARKKGIFTGKSKITNQNLSELEEVNKSNRTQLLELINNKGFPNENNLGTRGGFIVRRYACLLHQRDSVFIANYDFEALKKGYITPSYYALKHRQYSQTLGKEDKFYFYEEIRKMSAEQIEDADSARYCIGLLSLSDMEIQKKYFRNKKKNRYKFVLSFSL